MRRGKGEEGGKEERREEKGHEGRGVNGKLGLGQIKKKFIGLKS